MTEKRFSVDDDGIYDTQEKKHFKFIAYDWMECDIYECCEKLNEQQATISQLQDLCGESDGENAKLRIENKKLKEMNEQLQHYKLYEDNKRLQTIIADLKEENEQLRQKLDFYLLDEFEWKEKYGD